MKGKFPVVYVEWDDSESTYGWRAPETPKPAAIRSIGVLANKDKNGVIISTSKTEYGKYVNQLWIPRSAIRKMKNIKL